MDTPTLKDPEMHYYLFYYILNSTILEVSNLYFSKLDVHLIYLKSSMTNSETNLRNSIYKLGTNDKNLTVELEKETKK